MTRCAERLLDSTEPTVAAALGCDTLRQDCSRFVLAQDGNSLLGTILRILEVFLPFVNLIIFIAQASFQAKWDVGISGRVGLSLFVCIEALLHGGLVRASGGFPS